MANGPVNDDLLKDSLSDLAAGSHFGAMKCHLYSNNVTPTDANVLADFTECTFAGYTPQSVTSWSTPTVTSHQGAMSAATITFTLTSGTQTVYGAYLTDSANSKLYGAVRDPNAPTTLNTTVSQYQVTITFTDVSQY